MRCPFLREEQVKACQAAPFRKPLARAALKGALERCSSPDHLSCPALHSSREAHPAPARCPFLQESLVQFCAAAPRPTFVPWSESPELRCGHDGHRFCELFLAVAGPPGRGPARATADASASRTFDVDGVAMPAWLYYAPNHLWLDFGDDGLVHLGVDAFVTRLVGVVERLAFVTLKGCVRPSAVLSVHGVDLALTFARPLHVVAANTRLRANPERLTADPYGLGWLFEARLDARGAAGAEEAAGLRSGAAARGWMAEELRRAAALVHQRTAPRSSLGPLLADGGRPSPDLIRHLERDEVLRLFAELFPVSADPRRIA